ncbi:patatin-like phospholipase family protein [Pullulanibacillus sp. KACC 23026]|uniref:patatin-like phospholipase family protein n=1 Tax=Pullulanibacillus sp. KACC 23026 TaxID=3028315 RepID=UPI0023AED73F|nr:patatin-like phospholipase family protein [Pullulanibacillus sp. KACC 23026]WEG11682.1 patatin-like phospholipase family protein [Pullulanibacillus sp. KACC 23026]
MTRPTIGLALGSGGAKGFAHIGVIKVLEEAGIPIDYIAGSSMGALVAALYGVGHNWKSMERMALAFRRNHYLDFTVPKMGFITGKKLTDLIRVLSYQKHFEDCRLPVKIVATDLIRGERVILDSGPLYKAVRASISIPGVFVPVKWGGRIFVDGGVIDRVPTKVVRDMGADLVLSVDVSSFSGEAVIHSIIDVMVQSLDIMQQHLVNQQESHADLLMKPPVSNFNSTAFTNLDRIIAIGEKTARQHIRDLQRLIANWKD